MDLCFLEWNNYLTSVTLGLNDATLWQEFAHVFFWLVNLASILLRETL